MNPDTTAQSNSIPGLLRELRDDAGTLLKQQVTLAKVELKENVSRLGGHLAKVAVGGVVTLVGATVLLIGLGQLLGVLLEAAGLSDDTAQWLGPVIIGLVVAVIGWALLSKAKKALAQESITPRQTIESLKADQQWAQNKLQHSHESTT
ncbi:MAG TPA: phage holin family protein [Opitutus sp.]|nr:phage holin family protein [Opitutus sp.]